MSQTRRQTQMLMAAAIIMLLAGAPARVAAHPHVFIDNRLCFVFDGQGLAGVHLTWRFDDMFGAGFIMDYDRDGDGVFSDDEVRHIQHEAFDHLRNYHYFTRIFINGREFSVRYITDFHARISQGTLVYSFLIPCHVTAGPVPKEVRVMVYDSEYYSAIDSPPGCAHVSRAAGYDTRITQACNQEISFYFGMVHPDEITLRFSRKAP